MSADKVQRAADAMAKSGLINHGWTYVNIDDFWQNHRDSEDQSLRASLRDEAGNIVPNARFGDMKALADYVHGLGLKIWSVLQSRSMDLWRLRRQLRS